MSTAWPCCAIRSSPTQTRYLHASAKGGPAPLRLAYDNEPERLLRGEAVFPRDNLLRAFRATGPGWQQGDD